MTLTPQGMSRYADPLVLYVRLQDCIEQEMLRVARWREAMDSAEFYMARGREQAFRAVSSALVGIEDELRRYEHND
jgi:hypothetical protein